VTTAYSGRQRTAWASWIDRLTCALNAVVALLLGALLAIDIRQSEERPGGSVFHLLRGLFLIATGVLFVIVVQYGDALFDYSRCPIRAWLGPHLALTLGYSAVLAAVVSRPRLRRALTLVMVLLAMSVLALAPAKSHIYRAGWLGPQSLVVASCALAPLILSASIFALHAGLLWRGPEARLPRRCAAGALAGLLALLSLCAWRIYATPFAEHLLAEQRTGRFFERRTLLAVLAASAVGLGLGLGGAWLHRRRGIDLSFERTGRVLLRRTAKHLGAMAAAGLLLGLLSAAGNELVRRSSFLQYHLPAPHWPSLSAIPLASYAALMLIGAAWMLATEVTEVRSNRRLAGVLCLATALLGPLHLWACVGTHHESRFLRAVWALDAETGDVRWSWEGLAAPREATHRENSHATPTVAVEGDHVVAHFGGAGLVCLSLQTGQERWLQPEATYQSVYGSGASPVITAGLAILVSDAPQRPQILAYDLHTGELAWRHDRSIYVADVDATSGHSGTPLPIPVENRPGLVVWGWDRLIVYCAATGEVLVEHAMSGGGGDRVTSVTGDDERLYLGNPRELIAVSRSSVQHSGAACTWRVRTNSNCVTPVAAGGRVICCSDGGVVQCLDADSGERQWRERLPGEFRSSPLVAAERVYVGNLSGAMWMLDLQNSERRWHSADCGGAIFATPAATGGKIFLRTEHELLCVAGPSAR
jgi:outer membrane protein assembly factor BamB